MGDPRKVRKKYTTPMHPWQGDRIEEERPLKKDYGLKNKTEIYKMRSKLTDFKNRVKLLSAQTTPQSEIERQQLHKKLVSLGLLKQEDPLSTTLSLTLQNVMDRRMQTVLVKLGRARTVKQARQMIVHGHVAIAGRKLTTPGHITTLVEEGNLEFLENSPFIDENHPERFKEEAPAMKPKPMPKADKEVEKIIEKPEGPKQKKVKKAKADEELEAPEDSELVVKEEVGAIIEDLDKVDEQ
ncbi:MAG: 30S ribosomal protein S4 [Candidatus Woesearchaeota archaeon]